MFMGESIRLVSSVGIFVTMNPGYAGRTELPENLKALFRPCAMVVPDLALICEIMLVAEGFQSARSLARKFISLYTLCRQLLSAQDHYDWGLRAIKSVLVVAGKLRVCLIDYICLNNCLCSSATIAKSQRITFCCERFATLISRK